MSVETVKRYAQTAHGFTKWTVIRRGASSWSAAKADAAGNLDDGVLVVSVPNNNEFDAYAGEGWIEEAAHGQGNPGDRLYLSQVTGGALTTTAPLGGIVRELGYVATSDLIHWAPQVAFVI